MIDMIHHLSDHLLHGAQNWDRISMCLDLEGVAAAEDTSTVSLILSARASNPWGQLCVVEEVGKLARGEDMLSTALVVWSTHYRSRSWHRQDSLFHPLLPAISSLSAISWLPAISITASTICHQQHYLSSTQQHYFICRHQHVTPSNLFPPTSAHVRCLADGGRPTCTTGPTYLWALPSACVDVGNYPGRQGLLLLPAGRRQNRAISIWGDKWRKAGTCSKTAGMGGVQNSQQWAWGCGNYYMALTAYTRELKCRCATRCGRSSCQC